MRIIPTILALLAAAFLAATPSNAEESALPQVEAVMAAPPATGLVVVAVAPDGQAASVGIRPGDVLIAYAGTPIPSIEDLSAAKRVASQTYGAEVSVDLVRADGSEERIPLAAGTLGVEILPVVEGTSAIGLPPATEILFTPSTLPDAARNVWMGIAFPPAPKIGFQHLRLEPGDTTLQLRREVAFDGGRRWGLTHVIVTIEVDAADPTLVRRVSYDAPLMEYRSEGSMARREDGSRVWRQSWSGRDPQTGDRRGGGHEVGVPDGLPVVPVYFTEVLAALMPREAGACFHFRPLSEDDGSLSLHSALVVVGPETIQVGNGEATAWRIEQRRAGGQTVGLYWFDDEGRLLRADYGGPVAYRTSAEDATARIHPDIRVQTAPE